MHGVIDMTESSSAYSLTLLGLMYMTPRSQCTFDNVYRGYMFYMAPQGKNLQLKIQISLRNRTQKRINMEI